MIRVLELIRRFAGLDTPTVIRGETGTGKELVAQALHTLGNRSRNTMVTVDCGAILESLVESELFGHERGAFTGADRPYAGRIQAAAGGTLFLDEVNSISLAMQTKLLRFLEEGELCRVGQQRPVAVDVRLIAASNVSLEQLVASGAMRPDFFYRLTVLTIELPPLRERLDDLLLLVNQFLSNDPLAQRAGVRGVSDSVMTQLRERSWPGNIRELRNLLRRSVALHADGAVLQRLESVQETPAPKAPSQVTSPIWAEAAFQPSSFRAWMREREREYLTNLVHHHTSISQRVAASGLPQRTLNRKLKRLGLSSGSKSGGHVLSLVPDVSHPVPSRDGLVEI